MSCTQFHGIKMFILRHAWLNLWDKHMTTGRINQVTFVRERWEAFHTAECKLQRECDPVRMHSIPAIALPTSVRFNRTVSLTTLLTSPLMANMRMADRLGVLSVIQNTNHRVGTVSHTCSLLPSTLPLRYAQRRTRWKKRRIWVSDALVSLYSSSASSLTNTSSVCVQMVPWSYHFKHVTAIWRLNRISTL